MVQYGGITNLFFTILFGILCYQANGEDIPRLIWTSSRSSMKMSGVYSAPALPNHQHKFVGKVITTKIATLRYPHFLASLSCNEYSKEITAVDVGRGNIVTFNAEQRSIIRHHSGISNQVGGIAVDWTNGNIYWTDEYRGWISASNWELKQIYHVVSNVEKPTAIAVFPEQGYLFWTQRNNTETMIMRSTLSGQDPVIITMTTSDVTALTVDYWESRIYWIDSDDNSVYSAEVTGEGEAEMLYFNHDASFNDLTIYQDFVFLTEFNGNQILMVNKTSKELTHSINTASPQGICVIGGDAQPFSPGPCDINNGGCEQLCFPQPPGNVRKCGCSLGLVLNENGTACISYLIEEDFFLVVDSDMHWIFQISSDGKTFSRLNIPQVKSPVQVEFDPETKIVYWTDVGTKSVNRAKWDGSEFRKLVEKNVEQPTGLALDKMSGNLYWTDEGSGTVNVIRVDGTHMKTIASENVKSPRALVIDPFLGMMWWSDWSTKTIEMSEMDGTNRKTIVNKGIEWANGIAIDYAEGKLYWCDAHTDIIYTSELDGKDRKIFRKFKDNVHMFGIAVDEDYVYWTDWNNQSVLRSLKNEPDADVEAFGPEIFDKLSDIHNFVDTRGLSELLELRHPCRIRNGDCAGLCIPVPVNQTNSADHEVTRVCRCGRDYNGSCEKPLNNAIDNIRPSFNGTCPDDMILTAAPCQDKVLINYTKPTAIDNSGEVIVIASDLSPTMYLPEGQYDRTYIATDAAGNNETCHFTITVKVIRCPNPIGLIQSRDHLEIVESSCGTLQGSRVNLTCANETEIAMTDFITCGSDGEWKGNPMCYVTPPYVEEATQESKKSSEEDVHSTNIPSTTTKAITTRKNKVISEHVQVKPESSTPQTKSQQTKATTTIRTSTLENLNKHKQEILSYSDRRDLIALLIPAVLVVIILIGAAICYGCCRNRSLPIIETVEKKLTFFNLREADEARDTASFGEDVRRLSMQRKDSIPPPEEEPVYAQVARNGASVIEQDEITVHSARNTKLPEERRYATLETVSSMSMTRTTPSHSGYGTMK